MKLHKLLLSAFLSLALVIPSAAATVSNAAITADHVVANIAFANSSAITTEVTWATSSGSLVLNGTCTTATTADIVLVKKSN